MNFLLAWLRWGLAALLYFHNAKLSQAAPTQGDGKKHHSEVIQFLDVYNRSMCRSIETMVDIFQEYPDEVEYIFMPSCVPLLRCAGCCNDEALECVALEVHNVTMEIMRIKPLVSQHINLMSFQHRSKCGCRPKKETRTKLEKCEKPRRNSAVDINFGLNDGKWLMQELFSSRKHHWNLESSTPDGYLYKGYMAGSTWKQEWGPVHR
ncbi:vascular endothelial growth factor A, long form isoform X5 [Paroedura picta]|uniref:vascular endothelial growth factor A, long form isoform X5 n=1 Tax=Paroedura picta TaxID=143630 RepID=UPI004056F23E